MTNIDLWIADRLGQANRECGQDHVLQCNERAGVEPTLPCQDALGSRAASWKMPWDDVIRGGCAYPITAG